MAIRFSCHDSEFSSGSGTPQPMLLVPFTNNETVSLKPKQRELQKGYAVSDFKVVLMGLAQTLAASNLLLD